MSASLIAAAVGIGSSLIEKIWPDPAKQQEALFKLKELEQKGDLAELQAHVAGLQGQMAVNLEEAKHPSIFVAGWRPWVGWICGFSLAYAAILKPFIEFIALVSGYTGTFPVLDASITMPVLLGMLGIGAQRSYDKKNGVDTSKVTPASGGK